jgi:hypothetical protein
MKKLFIVLFVLFAFAFTVNADQAVQVTLAWDANSESNLAGYRLFYNDTSGVPYDGVNASEGESPITINLEDLADATNPMYTITLVGDGSEDVTEYFALTAFDTDGLESGYSEEVSTLLDYLQEDIDVNEDPPGTPGTVRVVSTVTITVTVTGSTD